MSYLNDIIHLCETGQNQPLKDFLDKLTTKEGISVDLNTMKTRPSTLRKEARPAYHEQMTPLHCAAKGGYADVVKTLIDRGADISCLTSRTKGLASDHEFYPSHSALALAVQYNHFETMVTLIEAGADALAPLPLIQAFFLRQQQTTLDIALEQQNCQILHFLIKHYDVKVGEAHLELIPEALKKKGPNEQKSEAMHRAAKVATAILEHRYWNLDREFVDTANFSSCAVSEIVQMVFLFVPADLNTLLSLGQVAKGWRTRSECLPQWQVLGISRFDTSAMLWNRRRFVAMSETEKEEEEQRRKDRDGGAQSPEEVPFTADSERKKRGRDFF